MSMLSDREIIERCNKPGPGIPGSGMISPFAPEQISQYEGRKVISYGVSGYGYDIRTSSDFKVFTNVHGGVIDPKNFDENMLVDMVPEKGPHGSFITVPPNSFCLARSLEWMNIPRDIMTICIGKSTYARCGIVVNVTPLEPEWRGHITIEISNTAPLPARIYANEGIMQVIFLRASSICAESYADKKGKYQDTHGIVSARMKPSEAETEAMMRGMDSSQRTLDRMETTRDELAIRYANITAKIVTFDRRIALLREIVDAQESDVTQLRVEQWETDRALRRRKEVVINRFGMVEDPGNGRGPNEEDAAGNQEGA